jgi:hypothetical protein
MMSASTGSDGLSAAAVAAGEATASISSLATAIAERQKTGRQQCQYKQKMDKFSPRINFQLLKALLALQLYRTVLTNVDFYGVSCPCNLFHNKEISQKDEGKKQPWTLFP